MTEIWRLDATAQAELVQRGEVTAAELTTLAIDRIESLNPAINAVVHKLYASAAARANTALEGPFAGVPMLVKDASLQIEGTPYTIGTTVLRDAGYRSDHTTELARRFLSAGFVIAGKTNVPEMSAGVTTEPAGFGATRNPWDLARSPGGSSGGSAAAVACGMTPIAHGGDGTGSLRYPASMCGVVTLKPTRGPVPSSTPTGLPEDGVGVWSEFVLARSVRDLAGVFDAVVDPGGTSPARAAIQHDAVRELRVSLLQSHVMLDAIKIDDDCARAVARAGELLATLGHHIEEEHPPALDGMFARIGGAVVRTGIAYRHAHYRRLCEMAGRELTMDDLSAEHIVSDEQRAQISDVDLANAAVTLAHDSAELLRWWDDHDVLVTPVLVKPPWPLGTPAEFQDVGGFPSPFSFSGQPAMSVPLHWTADGLPVGVQLVGAPGRDGELLRLARQIEEAAPWAHRWPPISSPGTRPLEPGT